MDTEKKGVPAWVWIVALVPVAVFMLGLFSALAIYGVRKYIANAKQEEARATLISWGEGLVRCGEKVTGLPPSTRPVPASLSEVAAKKYQSAPSDWNETAHSCASFSLTAPQYFQYRWERISANQGVVHAVADLDGNATPDVSLDLDVTCARGRCERGTPVRMDEPDSPGAGSARAAPGDPEAGVLLPPPPAMGPLAPLRGEPADLSSVMGRARKLVSEWQADAELVGIEATSIVGTRIQTQDGGTARVTFGPSHFNVEQRAGVFVVTYDKTGISGAPAKGPAPPALPEPMCAPEFVYRRMAVDGQTPVISLRYALDQDRPVWLAQLAGDANAKPIAFDPQSCQAAAIRVRR